MSGPDKIVAAGVSFTASPNARDIVLRLHDDGGAVVALVLIDDAGAELVEQAIAAARSELVAKGSGVVH